MIAAALAMGAGFAHGSDDEATLGKALFRRVWVPAPTKTDASDGLGPVFNARSCAACHPGGGGALARIASDGTQEVGGIVFRIAGPDGAPHPRYGRQVQTHAVPGLAAEAKARLAIDPAASGGVRADITFLDGAPGEGFHVAPRIAPSLRARGRIENVAEAAIRQRAAPDVQQSLGLAGRLRLIERNGREVIGRFGWKASEPNLEEQTADAFAFDIGLSSPERPLPYGDCTPKQTACLTLPTGESALFEGRELSSAMVRAVAAYVSTLDMPQAEPNPVQDALLAKAGCTGCHTPRLASKTGGEVEIYSDLLLHDMGAGLDDGIAEAGVRAAEWRTAPLLDLWTRDGTRRYLHDGRAATIRDAIGAHGGEAEASRTAFDALTAAEQAALIRDLETR